MDPMVILGRKHEEIRLGVISSSKGRAAAKPKAVILAFVSLSLFNPDRYEPARKLTVLADSKRHPLGETQRSAQTHNGIYTESMLAAVPYETFLQIIYAKKIVVRLGTTEIGLTSDHITQLRAAASYMAQ